MIPNRLRKLNKHFLLFLTKTLPDANFAIIDTSVHLLELIPPFYGFIYQNYTRKLNLTLHSFTTAAISRRLLHILSCIYFTK